MSVLVVGPVPPPSGGAAVSFALLLEHLQGRQNLDIEHVDFPMRSGQFDGVAPLTTFFKTLSLCLKLFGKKGLILAASPGTQFSYGLVLIIFAKLIGKPVSLRFFGGHPSNGLKRFPTFMHGLLCRILGLAKVIYLQTEAGKGELPAFLAPKIQLIAGYRSIAGRRTEPNPDEDTIHVVCPTVAAKKGVEVFHRAYERLREQGAVDERVQFHVFGHYYAEGPSPVAETLRRSPRVLYHENLNSQAFQAKLRDAHFLVFPSLHKNEGHPGVIVEAQIAGLPVICSDLPGPRELVQDGVNGRIIALNDDAALANAIRDLIANHEERRNLARHAIDHAARFDQNLLVPKLADGLLAPILEST